MDINSFYKDLIRGLEEGQIDYKSALKSNWWFKVGIEAIAKRLSKPDWNGNDKMVNLINYPNQNQSKFEFYKEFLTNFYIDGIGVMWYVDGQLYNLKKSEFRYKTNKYGDIVKFEIYDNNLWVEEDLSNLIVIRNPDDKSPFADLKYKLYGFNQMDKYVASFFYNNATPSTILLLEQRLSEEQKQNFLKNWMDRFRGVKKSGKVAVLSGTRGDIKTIGLPLDKAQIIEFENLIQEAVLSILGVPPAVVGIFRYANYANAYVQRQMMWEDTILPWLQILKLSYSKFAKIHNLGEINYDISMITVLQQNLSEILDNALKLQQLGYSRDEIEGILNFNQSNKKNYKKEVKKEVDNGLVKKVKKLADKEFEKAYNKLVKSVKNDFSDYVFFLRTNLLSSINDVINGDLFKDENDLNSLKSKINKKLKNLDIDLTSFITNTLDKVDVKFNYIKVEKLVDEVVNELKKIIRDSIRENVNYPTDELVEFIKISINPKVIGSRLASVFAFNVINYIIQTSTKGLNCVVDIKKKVFKNSEEDMILSINYNIKEESYD